MKAAGELLCFYINARNLINKFDDFEAWVHDINPDIVGVTESWSTPSISDAELTLQGYDLFRQDRPVTREGGGVLLYVNQRLQAVKCELSSKFPEHVWCYFQDEKNIKCYVGVCYRTPTVNIYGSSNHDLLQSLINELGTTKKHFMLMGDLNYRILSWPPLAHDSNITREALDFFDCLEENFFTQHVMECTRKDAILDLVITDEPAMIHDLVNLGTFPGSDHSALLWTLEVKTVYNECHRQTFDYSKANTEDIKSELQTVDWHKLFGDSDAEQNWLAFKELMEYLQLKYIPVKGRLNKRRKPIWMTNKALQAVRHRRRIYRKYKDTSHPAYITAAKKAHDQVKDARRNFEHCLAKKIKEDRKSFFAYVRSKSKSNVTVGSLVSEHGQITSDPEEKAEILNDFFCSVFTKEINSDMPVPDTCFAGNNDDRLEDIAITPELILKKLQQLKLDKAAGDDNLSPRLLKSISSEIALPIAMIFRKSLDSGCVPRDWRTANITPLFKKGKRSQAENYRPVSLTSLICKIVEAVLRDELVRHLDKHNLIKDSQHGFRKGYSCASNLLTFLEMVTACIDGKMPIDTIYLDLAKAFDKVPHERLVSKLKAHGIDGLVCTWIKAWLTDRQQRVCLDGRYSRWRPVWSGVPQGSVLGPILFLIFINDLDNGLSSSVLKFADDTKLFRPVSNCIDSQELQLDLDNICRWASRWQMEFNVSKCKVIHYGNGNMGCNYSMEGLPVEEADCEKDLGVTFTSDLKATVHCKDVYSKANRMLGLLSRTIKYKNPAVLTTLYKSMVRPHLEYCSTIWNPHYNKDKLLLERVQHRFTRIFPHLRSLPYESRLRQLGLWTLEERRSRADLIELFKIVKGLSSIHWSHFFKKAEDTSTRGHTWKLVKMHSRCDTRLHFFSQRVINRWNNLSQEDVDAQSINCFKSRLEKRRARQMDFFKDL